MGLTANEIRKIRGIGDVLAIRLLEAGHDTYLKIANLGESGLKGIRGMNPKAVPEILAQAKTLAAGESSDRERKVADLKESMQGLRRSVQGLTRVATERFGEKLSGKPGRKLTDALVRFIEVLEALEGKAGRKVKRTGKVLVRAEQHLEGLAEAGLKDLRRGLKKARKALQRVNP